MKKRFSWNKELLKEIVLWNTDFLMKGNVLWNKDFFNEGKCFIWNTDFSMKKIAYERKI